MNKRKRKIKGIIEVILALIFGILTFCLIFWVGLVLIDYVEGLGIALCCSSFVLGPCLGAFLVYKISKKIG